MNKKLPTIVLIVLMGFTIAVLASALRQAWENERVLSNQLNQIHAK
jgi:hypothetical protein